MSLEDFFTLPATNPFRENVLEPNEIVVEVTVPAAKSNTKSFYLKAREKGAPRFRIVKRSRGLRDGGKHL